MGKKTIRIGLLSFAHLHAISYVTHLQKRPGVEIVGLWNEDTGTAEKKSETSDCRCRKPSKPESLSSRPKQ